jgi:hypothetical protein
MIHVTSQGIRTSYWFRSDDDPNVEINLDLPSPTGVDFAGDGLPIYGSIARGSHDLLPYDEATMEKFDPLVRGVIDLIMQTVPLSHRGTADPYHIQVNPHVFTVHFADWEAQGHFSDFVRDLLEAMASQLARQVEPVAA